VLVIRTKRVDGVKLYWRLDGSLLVRSYPAAVGGRYNIAGWFVGNMARAVVGRSALRVRDCWGWALGMLIGAVAVAGGLATVCSGESFGGWAVGAVAAWMAMVLAMAITCVRLAEKASWCQYWWGAVDRVTQGEGDCAALSEALSQSEALSGDSLDKLLYQLISWVAVVGISRRPKPALRGVSVSKRWVRYKSVWCEVRRKKPLPGWAVEAAVAIWEPSGADALRDLGVALEAAGHLVRTSA